MTPCCLVGFLIAAAIRKGHQKVLPNKFCFLFVILLLKWGKTEGETFFQGTFAHLLPVPGKEKENHLETWVKTI